MKKFKEYIEQVKPAKSLREFPVKKDTNYTVVFIMPEMNTAEGIYRSLLPSFYLNKLTTVRALPVGVTDVRQSLSINQKDYTIKDDLIKVADHLVFPFTSQPLRPLIEDLRGRKPKLKFSYYIDYNFYFVPDSYPFVKEYSGAEIIANIEDNIVVMDQVIVNSTGFYNYLNLELSQKEHVKGSGTDLVNQPLFYDKTLFPEIEEKREKKEKIRFGMVMNQYHFADLNFIKGILKEFLKNHSSKAEIVLLGWNGTHKGKNYLSNLNIEYHPEVPFYDYFKKLRELDLDCAIIPAKPNKFNDTSKNLIKFYEFTRMGIPVIAPNTGQYKLAIEHNDNAVLCDSKESWLFEMETFLKDAEKYRGLQDRAFNSIVEKEISDEDNIEILMDIYVI